MGIVDMLSRFVYQICKMLLSRRHYIMFFLFHEYNYVNAPSCVLPSPSKCVEATEDVWHGLAALGGRHLTLATLHQFGGHLATRAVLQERFARLPQYRHRHTNQRLRKRRALVGWIDSRTNINTTEHGIY